MADNIETSIGAAIENGSIHGAVMCATDAEGSFVYEKALGQRTLLSGDKCPQQIDDVLCLASATKLVTTIAALQCVEDGLLTLTGDLSGIAPELSEKGVITGYIDDEEPQIEPAADPITLEMLLTHSSGQCYHFVNPLIAKWRKKFAGPKEAEAESQLLVEEMFNNPLAFQPGAGWMYGSGLDWAGRIVERVTGMSLCERMQQRIFDPLGISDAQFYPVTREELRGRLVNLNPEDPDGLGLAVGGGGEMNKTLRGDYGGHGLFMSGSSYVKILHSLLANDSKLLSPATVDDMFQHHLSPAATASHQAALAGPMGSFFRVGVDATTKLGYGLGGLLTREDTEGWYGEGTLTWGGGMTLTWFIDRANNLCGVGAVQAALPLKMKEIEALKQTFRKDIYRKRSAWREQQA